MKARFIKITIIYQNINYIWPHFTIGGSLRGPAGKGGKIIYSIHNAQENWVFKHQHSGLYWPVAKLIVTYKLEEHYSNEQCE